MSTTLHDHLKPLVERYEIQLDDRDLERIDAYQLSMEGAESYRYFKALVRVVLENALEANLKSLGLVLVSREQFDHIVEFLDTNTNNPFNKDEVDMLIEDLVGRTRRRTTPLRHLLSFFSR